MNLTTAFWQVLGLFGPGAGLGLLVLALVALVMVSLIVFAMLTGKRLQLGQFIIWERHAPPLLTPPPTLPTTTPKKAQLKTPKASVAYSKKKRQ